MKKLKCVSNFLVFTMLFAIASVALISPVYAGGGQKNQSNGDKLWRKIDESRVQKRGERTVIPEKYLVFRLDETLLKNSLARLPLENTDAARENPLVLEIPMPDGTIARFRVEETPVLAPHLAADFPTWKTFIGYGVDDTGATARFDWNALGFHGYISTAKGIVMIDPYQTGEKQTYLVFYKHDFGKSDVGFYCRVEEKMSKIIKSESEFFEPATQEFSFGTTVRTYRLAVATTGEWARAAANYDENQTPTQTRTAALAVITTTVNRLNGIYERELASRFQLVNPTVTDEAANIVFDNPTTDPYNNTDEIPQLTVNHNTITNRLGTPNFDVGHLYGTGGGGVAQSPSLCSNTQKGKGYSARGTQTGDPFVVDYVAHELGHQFGSDHTYNNIDPNGMGACPLSSYSAQDAYEPGSGSTIMSYVGICGARNLQQNVDFALPMFHIRSLTVIHENITTGDPQTTNCGTTTGTNNIPTVNAGASFTIPRLTPFTLTATGNDADANDVANLLYSWEEYDLAQRPSGIAGNPAGTYDVDTDGFERPQFRAYSPVSTTSRTFPSLAFILNPANNSPAGSNQPALTYTGTHPTNAPGAVCEPTVTCVIGERLPTINRTMNFRVAIRDRRGGVADAGTSVTIVEAAGPFEITSQNTGVTYAGNSTQTVSWDVAGTNANGINAANVKISFSTNGGLTFPTTLVASTPNDGSQTITVPNVTTAQGRIKVEAVGNIFFDINNANITVNAAPTAGIRAPFDYDGDDKTDLSIYRPSAGQWWYQRSSDNSVFAATFGGGSDRIVPADFTGDQKTDFAIFRPATGEWFVLRSEDFSFYALPFGTNGDTPVPADYDGDNKADVAVFRPSTNFWFIQKSAGGTDIIGFGTGGDKPAVGDYDGDNKSDIAIYRPGLGQWWIRRSSDTSIFAATFGNSTDKQVQGFYTADNRTDMAIFRPSTGEWFILRSEDFSFYSFPFGTSTDVPVPGDYDGDNRFDAGVFRPSTNTWFIQRTTAGTLIQTFGTGGDLPTPNAYVP